MNDFETANAKVHPVREQWHYKYLTQAGFVPETREAVGFVRSYVYHHSDGRTVTCTTGSSADYWRSSDGQGGYWKDLEHYCLPLTSS